MQKVKKTFDGVQLSHDEARQIFGEKYQKTVRQYPETKSGGSEMWKVYDLYLPTCYGVARAIDTDYYGTTFAIEIKGNQKSENVKEYQKNAEILKIK
ncbi:MAG: hypothetical protein RBR98_03995 [Candidatus Moranbacteria bacterium]|jgi:hypothetical protein|nr:hypothetical protein [Candidatus Moranbacteria bacterium]